METPPSLTYIQRLQQELRAALKQHQQATTPPAVTGSFHAPPSASLPDGYWRALHEGTRGMLAVLDLDGRYLETNAAWQQAFGLEPDWQGQSHLAVCQAQAAAWQSVLDAILLEIPQYFEGGTDWMPTGPTRWYDWEVLPWYQAGAVAGAIILATDRTEGRQLRFRAGKLQKQLNLALRLAGLALAQWHLPRGEMRLDERIAHWLGLPAESPIPFTLFYGCIHPDDRQEFDLYWQQPWEQGHSLEREYRLLRADGTPMYCLERIEFTRNRQGRISQAISVFQDISHLREAQASLEESERRFRGIFHQMFQFIGLMKPDGTLIEANDTALNFAGVSSQDVIGRPFWEGRWWQHDPEAQDQLREAIARAAKGELVRYEAEVQGHGGQRAIIDFSLKPVWGDHGEVVLLIPEGRDVTEARRTQQRLATAEYMFTQFMDNSPALAWIKDQALRFCYVNRTFEQAVNRQADWLIGRTDDEVIAQPEQVAEIRANDAHVLHTGKVLHTVEHATQPDGRLAHNLIYKFPVTMEDGSPAVGGVAIDITAQVQAEQELRRLNQSLEARVAERTLRIEATEQELARLAYSIAHDLRAPLRHIAAYTDLVLENAHARLAEDELQHLHRVFSAAERLGDMVDELLKYASTDRQELDVAPVSLDALVQELIDLLTSPDRQVRWQVDELPTIRADCLMMRQLFQNLLENALKFTQEQTTAHISITCQSGTDTFTLAVSDNGVGFNPDYADKLFKLFQRLHPKRQYPGTGIGLANVQRIAMRHGGRVHAEGQENQGATFYLTFPNALLI